MIYLGESGKKIGLLKGISLFAAITTTENLQICKESSFMYSYAIERHKNRYDQMPTFMFVRID